MRKEMAKKTILTLKGEDGTKYTYEIEKLLPGSNNGATCLCYIALREEEGTSERIILKEFYPQNDSYSIMRNSDNSLNIQELLDSEGTESELFHDLSFFKKSNKYIEKYNQNSTTSDGICASNNTSFLVGNGTYYYENAYQPKSKSLKDCSKQGDIKDDELLQIAIGYNKFLKKMHIFPNQSSNGDAMVDIKPDDVLVPVGKVGLLSYGSPKFYDFGSVLELNRTYPLSQISATPAYCPKEFDSSRNKTGTADVSIFTEHYSLARVINSIFGQDNKKKGIPSKALDMIKESIIKMQENKDFSDDNIESALTEARDKIREEEQRFHKGNLPHKKRLLNILRILLFIISIASYAAMTVVMGYLCLNREATYQYINDHNLSVIGIAVILGVITVALTLLKYGVFLLSRSVLRIDTSCTYFERKIDGKSINTGEYNTFRYGITRAQTTYIDTSSSNRRRQSIRHVLWASLTTVMVVSFVVSVIVKSFPLFVSVSLFAIIFQMYVDHFAGMYDYYNKCECLGILKDIKHNSLRKKKAAYYLYEYTASSRESQPFDLNSNYYKEHNRNIYKMRELLVDEEKDGEMPNFSFTPLIIRNIYKMAFDRIKNKNLILTIAVFIATVSAIFIGFASFTGKMTLFFRLSDASYIYVVMVMLILTTCANIYQIIFAFNDEKLVADYSYKSRFVLDFALNNLLVEDIIKKSLKNIDIVRGINQSEAIIASVVNRQSRKKMKHEDQILYDEREPYNAKMLHHNDISDRRRLALTVLMGWGIVFALVVWQLNLYFLAIPSVLVAIGVYSIVGYGLIPAITRKSTIKIIESLLNEQEKTSKTE